LEGIEEINGILLKINLKTEFTQEILIILSKKYNLKANDLIPMLELHENKKFI